MIDKDCLRNLEGQILELHKQSLVVVEDKKIITAIRDLEKLPIISYNINYDSTDIKEQLYICSVEFEQIGEQEIYFDGKGSTISEAINNVIDKYDDSICKDSTNN